MGSMSLIFVCNCHFCLCNLKIQIITFGINCILSKPDQMLFLNGFDFFFNQNVNGGMSVTVRVTDIKRWCNVLDIVQICNLQTTV